MNPLVLKELRQFARHRRMFVLRTALPIAAALLIATTGAEALARAEQNWREAAAIGRPVFVTTAWVELVAFSLLAALLAWDSLRREWRDGTMEVLRATPLSAGAIIRGKFIASVGAVFIIGLALLPVQAVWLHLGRLPPGIALGAFGVIAASTVLFGALGIAAAVELTPRDSQSAVIVLILIFTFCAPVLPVFFLAVPPLALHYVSTGTAPPGMSLTGFASLATGTILLLAVVILWRAPSAYESTCRRLTEEVAARERPHRRQPLDDRRSPLLWLEDGPGLRSMRLVFGMWSVLALAAAGGLYLSRPDYSGSSSEGDCFNALVALLGLVTGLCAAGVMVRERARRMWPDLLLTGRPASAFYRAKGLTIGRALLRALPGLVLAALFTVMLVGLRYRVYPAALVYAMVGLVGVGVVQVAGACFLGLAFGAAARTPAQAYAGLVVLAVAVNLPALAFSGTSLPWIGADRGENVFWMVGLLAVAGVLGGTARRWSVWRLTGFAMALGWLSDGVVSGLVDWAAPASSIYNNIVYRTPVMLLISALGAAVLALVWLVLGLRAFERNVLSDAPA
jgi:ABC-type transport system involved in cytochrome c biogenesis permease component